MKTFSQVLESVEALTPDEQENLVSIVQRRVREKRRAELVLRVRGRSPIFEYAGLTPTRPPVGIT